MFSERTYSVFQSLTGAAVRLALLSFAAFVCDSVLWRTNQPALFIAALSLQVRERPRTSVKLILCIPLPFSHSSS
jgi:hypothetical protein